MKLILSPNPTKKLRAVFNDGTHTDFGAEGMMDYTLYYKEDKELAEKRKKAYIARHTKDLETGDPKKAGFLSYYILWNLPTVARSLKDYKKRFGDL
jgi:hypothetical protein